jgi:hypothetical protein
MVDCVRRQDRENEEKIKKLINTAYHVCKTECPFLDAIFSMLKYWLTGTPL